MPGSHLTTSSCKDCKLVEKLETSFREAFGAQFDIWAQEADAWQCLTTLVENSAANLSEQLPAGDTAPLSDLLNRAGRKQKPIVTNLSDGRHLLVVPIDGLYRMPLAAVGVVSCQDTELIGKLATTILVTIQQQRELDEHADHMDAYAQQVSADFEELTWLRILSENIQYCDASNGIEDVSQKVLPSLCEVIRAETIILIPAERGKEAPQPVEKSVGQPTVRAGDRRISDEFCRQLVERFREAALVQPIVNNQLAQQLEFEEIPGLSSCILVAVATTDYQYGWLLALNKVGRGKESVNKNLESLSDGSSETQFGTFEAGLMDAVAVMLATHYCNFVHFREKECLLIGVVRSLINAMDAKDPYTCGHSDRVALIGRRLGEELQLSQPECERLYLTGLLHDIGKIGVRDDVLNKPGKLTEDEFNEIKQHPVIGYEILKHLEQLDYALPGVLHHHEAIDGRGYPHRLAGNEIPIFGRILGVADAYDAMTSSRPYRNAMSHEKAEAILHDGAGKQWDAQVVHALFNVLHDIRNICDKSYDHTQSILHADNQALTEYNAAGCDSIVSAVTAIRK